MPLMELETLGVVRTMTAAVGATIFAYGLRAYARTRRRSVLLFSTGMGIASAGYLLEGVLVNFAGWSLGAASGVEAAFTLVAFSLLATGMWVRDPVRVVEPELDAGDRPA